MGPFRQQSPRQVLSPDLCRAAPPARRDRKLEPAGQCDRSGAECQGAGELTMFARLRSLWKELAHRAAADRELDAELRFHIESRVEHFVRSGVRPAEARRRANLEFGSVENY